MQNNNQVRSKVENGYQMEFHVENLTNNQMEFHGEKMATRCKN
jgi:hypothetical protein